MTKEERIQQEANALYHDTITIMRQHEPEELDDITEEERKEAITKVFRPMAERAIARQLRAICTLMPGISISSLEKEGFL
jgi:hypothetical protein